MNKYKCAKCGGPVSVPDDAVVEAVVDAVGGGPLCDKCFDDWHAKAEVAHEGKPEPIITQRPTRYVFREGMGEISGFGGGYEQTCRNMLSAALDWFDEHPDADPKLKGFEEIYGVLMEDNADAKALSAAVLAAANGDCTGAMHQVVISSSLWIRHHGWDAYCDEMSKPEIER